jgi:hypothetical protein
MIAAHATYCRGHITISDLTGYHLHRYADFSNSVVLPLIKSQATSFLSNHVVISTAVRLMYVDLQSPNWFRLDFTSACRAEPFLIVVNAAGCHVRSYNEGSGVDHS